MTTVAIACILLAVAVTAWAGPRCAREARERREAEDRSYDGLRTPGMGDLSSLDPDAPAYSDLAAERPDVVVTLDDARLARERRGVR